MKKKLIMNIALAVALSGAFVSVSGNSYKAKALEAKAAVSTADISSPVTKYQSTIKAILKKNNQAVTSTQRITQVQPYKIKKSTILWVVVIRSESPFTHDEYLIDTAGKILCKESNDDSISNMTDQAFADKNSSMYFFEWRQDGKELNVIKIDSKIAAKKYAYKDLSEFEGYTPEMMFDKKGSYVFHLNGFSNGAEGGPGLTLVSKLDINKKKFVTKYRYDVNNAVLDKSKNLWLLDSECKDNENVTCKIYEVVNNKKVLKYTYKHKNAEPDLPIAWVNDRIKVISDKEAYIQPFESSKWIRLKK